MATNRQTELLMFIDKRITETGVPPSFDEMREALGLVSKSNVHHLLKKLEAQGFIRRPPGRARALEVIRLPGSENVVSQLLAKNEKMRKALMQIAAGDGVYGAQAHEYKQIARQALGATNHEH